MRKNIVCIDGKTWYQGDAKIIPTAEEVFNYFNLEDKYKVVPCSEGGYEVITKYFATKFPTEQAANAHRRSLIVQEINTYLEAANN